jgi:transcriptional regulator with XRE-family HTH domain
MEERKLTIAELSRTSGVGRSTIQGWLHGARPRDLQDVKRVANTLKVTFEFLCLGQEDRDLSKALSQAARKIEVEGLYYVRLERLEDK